MGIGQRQRGGTVMHSDRAPGSRVGRLPAIDSGLLHSIGSVGSCFDNAMIESFWGRMDVELLDSRSWADLVQPANATFEYPGALHESSFVGSSLRDYHTSMGWFGPDTKCAASGPSRSEARRGT
jgi:transposase InsO family protein